MPRVLPARPAHLDEASWAQMSPQLRQAVSQAMSTAVTAAVDRVKRQREHTPLLTSLLRSPKRRRLAGAGAGAGADDPAAADRELLARVAQCTAQTFLLSTRLQKLRTGVDACAARSAAAVNDSLATSLGLSRRRSLQEDGLSSAHLD